MLFTTTASGVFTENLDSSRADMVRGEKEGKINNLRVIQANGSNSFSLTSDLDQLSPLVFRDCYEFEAR